MSQYLIILIALISGAVIEHLNKKTHKLVYYACFAALTVMLCLRYGQGSDYFSYSILYDQIIETGFDALTMPEIHTEFGWKILCMLCGFLKIPFVALVFIIAVVEMTMLWLFINRCCRRRSLALLLCYHTLYLTYFFSALRQGLIIALFIGLMLDWLMKKKYIPYVILSLVCATVHSCALVLLILPLVQHPAVNSLKLQLIAVAAAWAAGLILTTGILDGIMQAILPQSILNYYSTRRLSITSLERVITYGITVFVYWKRRKEYGKVPDHLQLIMKIVSVGMVIYGGFLWLPLVASRLAYICKVTEIALICGMMLQNRKIERGILAYLAVFVVFMCIKNLGNYVSEGSYFAHINIFNYPYVSLLDKQEILEFRDVIYDVLP